MMNNHSMRGYTLLELIVAVGIFSIIMLAATGAYLTLISLDREARAVGDLVSNLSFASDSMARTIRTGHDYRCNDAASEATANCTAVNNPGTSLSFMDAETPSREILYYLDDGQVYVSINGAASPITDPRITITDLKFYVRGVGVESGTKTQPQVTFTMRGEMAVDPNDPSVRRSFIIQNSATQRLLEL